MQTSTQEDAPRALSIKQFCARYSVSPAKFYLLVNRGELTARKIGTKTVIETAEAERWFGTLPTFKAA